MAHRPRQGLRARRRAITPPGRTSRATRPPGTRRGALLAHGRHATVGAKTAPNQVRWWYRWGTNHNAYFHTNDSDAGADRVRGHGQHREAASIVTYPFAYFRRQNREYNYTTIPASVADRYYERIRSYPLARRQLVGLLPVVRQLGLGRDLERRRLASSRTSIAETEMFNFLAAVRADARARRLRLAGRRARSGQRRSMTSRPRARAFTIGIGRRPLRR